MTDKIAPDLAAVVAEIEKKVEDTAQAEAPAEIAKSDFSDLIDRLTKGDFGNTDAAHNGNELDKSAPMGQPADFSAGVKDAADAERNVDGAEARVAASVKRARGAQPPAPPTNLNKSDEDEDEDDIVKSSDEIDEEDIYGALVDGEGAEAYVPVAEASEAIQYLTDTLAKAFTHMSAQLAALATESHERYDRIEKSNAVSREAIAELLKSAAPRVEEPIKKSMLTSPATGIVLVAPVADKSDKSAPQKSELFKSISKAMNGGHIEPFIAERLLRTLDTQGPSKVWESLTPAIREIITTTNA